MEHNLPPNWSWVKLDDVCEIVMGQSPPSSTYNTDQIGLPFFQGKAEFTELYPEVRKWCSEPNKIAEPLDILVSVRAPVGSSNIANQKCCIGRGLAAIRYPQCNKFVFYYFRLIEKKLDELGTGSTFKAISSKTLSNFNVPLPPLPEQKKIVEKIEELFSGLDSGVASLKKAKEQLRLYRQSVLAFAFSGRLTASPELVSGTPSGSGYKKLKRVQLDNNGLPEGWKWVKLGAVSEIINGFAFKSGEFKNQGHYQVIKIGNVRPGNLRLEEKPAFVHNVDNKVLDRSLLKQNDLIISLTETRKKRDYGYVAMITNQKNLLLNQRLAIIRLNKGYDSRFFLYLLRMDLFLDQFFRNETGNVGQGNVGVGGIKDSVVPVPSLTLQTQIVSEIEKRFSEADNLEKAIDDSLAKSELLRQSILSQAFSGKLIS
jgi:type I restriction enzyme S subunit